ncbi:MAG: helix-turn-helix domain-containing protein [Gammaproteobacteria bacterium]
MTTSRTGSNAARPLEILGVGEAEERAYRWLLTHPGAGVAEIAQALALAPSKAQRLLDTIETKGLTTHTPERPRRYLPVSPDIAMEALALRRQEDLQRARGIIRELQEQATATRRQRGGGEQEQTVELITSSEAERQIVEQMSRTAQHEVVALVRPPMLVSRLDVSPEQDTYTQREAQARGVRSRSIVDAEFLALPGAVARVRGDIKTGEEVRVLPRLPFKMVLTDRRLALIPLDLEQSSSPVLLVRSSALLEALYALFEILWARAAPISVTREGELKTGNPAARLPRDAEELIPLMAAGLNDKSIAYELGISASTLNRRIGEIMRALEARTRFQIGWLARGIWGPEQSSDKPR